MSFKKVIFKLDKLPVFSNHYFDVQTDVFICMLRMLKKEKVNFQITI